VTAKVRRLLSIDLGGGVVVHMAAGRAWVVSPGAFAAGAALGGLALARFGFTPHGVMSAALLMVLAVLAVIDLRTRLLPNLIVLPALGAVLLWQLAFFPDQAAEWLLAAGGAAVFLLLPSLLHSGAMGMGDVKLGALLGAALGAAVVPALLVGSLAVAPVAAVLAVRDGRAAARRATVPFGPFLAFGAAVILFAAG
jgi:leader peptidase (prepilin peptidase) / N-methyltransferase